MEQQTFNEKLTAWSKKVVEYCHEMATNPAYDLNLSFFSFRSPPKENPELLLLGINPGREDTYEDQLGNAIWGLTDVKRMTPERFIKEDPCWDNHEKWKIWEKLRISFDDERMRKLLSDSMYINFIYFNSKNIKSLLDKRGGVDAIEQCRKFSLELIANIIKPKRILCLGTANCFDLLPIDNKECLIWDRKRLLTIGELKGLSGIPIYGIPHPSGSRTSNKNRKRIGIKLQKEFGFA